MSNERGHRVIPPGLPLAVLAALFAFAGVITWLQGLPNPGYAERTGSVEVQIEALPRGAKAMQLRSRCGTEIVDTITVTQADFKLGDALRMLPLSASGDCFLEARELPSEGDFYGAGVGQGACRVGSTPVSVSCS